MPIAQDYSKFLKNFRSSKFKNLWPNQDCVLREYSDSFHDVADVAVELPTGAGKTLIALLIAEVWRRENMKVAILSANKTLARQMESEAINLGIPVVLMEGSGPDIPSGYKREYQRAIKIAVMNYWVYFNQNPVIDNSDLLIMDDAHLAEHCLHSLWSLEIDRYEHENLFKALVVELVNQFPEYSVLNDALDDNPLIKTPPELLSFIDQISVEERVKEIIDASPLLETNKDLYFRWNRIRNYFKEANIYLSLNSIWIRPYIYPLTANNHYANSTQRLYMSATIGEPSDLSRRLGANRIEKIPVPQDFAEATAGRRFIIMNRIEDEDLPKRLQSAILKTLCKCPKSVWLCTSRAKAEKFRQIVPEWLNQNRLIGHQNWLLSSFGDEIDHFKIADKGHLFVAGRFDGMDFKEDECRLVVMTTLPRAINTQEEFFSAYLRDAGFMNRRLNQRIVQALGRCNRSVEDYAIYVLADKRFATHFSRESRRTGIPKNITVEIDMAEDNAEIDIDILVEKIGAFLEGDFSDFDTELQSMLSSVPENIETPPTIDTSEDEVKGWAAMFSSQNYNVAAEKFENCWNKALEDNIIELGAYYGWCWAKALYLGALQGEGSKEESLNIFEKAINRGGKSSWFNRMRISLNRARNQTEAIPIIASEECSNAIITSFENLLDQVGKKNRFERWCNQLSQELESEHHNEFCHGLKKLGELLNYSATRPEYSSASDCIWRGIFGNSKELVTFEAKIEKDPSGEIIASDVGQVHNQLARAKKEYGNLGYIIRGVIITHLSQIADDAETSLGNILIIEKNSIIELWNLIKVLLSEYRRRWSLNDFDARLSAADAIRSRLPQSGWLIRTLDSDCIYIKPDLLLKEWRK